MTANPSTVAEDCTERELEITAPRAQRLPFIDALRGFALFGIFGANLMIFSGLSYMTPEQKAAVSTTSLDQIAFVLVRFLIENKFIGLFSLLFGISFWLFLNRPQASGRSTKLFYRRIGWLFLIGALHGWLLWCFDVLRFYALWAILLPLFVVISPRKLLLIALFTGVLAPATTVGLQGLFAEPANPATSLDALALASFSRGDFVEVIYANWMYDWYLTLSIGQLAYQLSVFGRLLFGLYVARALDLADLDRSRRLFKNLLLAGAIVGVLGNAVFAGELFGDAKGFFAIFVRRFVVESGFLGLTVAFASGLALLFLNTRLREAVQSLAPIGRMALTIYLLQTVFGIWLFYGFMPGPDLMGKVGPAWLVLVWVIGFAVQVVFAHVWMRRFRFGPMEWLWRSLTYWRLQPIRLDVAKTG